LIKEKIKKIIVKITNNILNADSQNIERYFYRESLSQSAEFIKNNFKEHKVFNNKFNILDYALNLANTDGLFLEFGVYQGLTINHIASKNNNTIYGFDSFCGLPEYWRDGFDKGAFSTRLPKVKANVILVPGWFDKSLPVFLSENKKNCSFIHIDCDLYSSAKVIFDLLEDRIDNTIIVFDEFFNYPGWLDGEFKAFKEFTDRNIEKYSIEYLAYNKIGEQVAIRLKKNK
jgi:hypothetical protein